MKDNYNNEDNIEMGDMSETPLFNDEGSGYESYRREIGISLVKSEENQNDTTQEKTHVESEDYASKNFMQEITRAETENDASENTMKEITRAEAEADESNDKKEENIIDSVSENTEAKLAASGENSDNNVDLNNADLDSTVDFDNDEDMPVLDVSYQFETDLSRQVEEALEAEVDRTDENNDEVEFEFDDIAPYISKDTENDINARKIKKARKRAKKKTNKAIDKDKTNETRLWSRMPRHTKVATIIVSCMLCVVIGVLIAFNTVFGGVFKDFSKADAQKEKFDTSKQFKGEDIEVVQVDEFNWDVIKGDSTYDENVYNILLLGGDNAKSTGVRGNSDTIMIISIDKNTKKIKVTSIMRDTYVQIPGYRDNKINSAFATGGVPLVKKTIEENFKITIDSAVVLNYSTFRVVIKELGGVDDVTINEKEAQFINKECRKKNIKSDLTEGTHNLNAYQALHFARIRKISSDIYGKDDFGRTARQRFVINQIFKKYKDLSYTELARLATKVVKEVEVDKNLKKDIFLLIQVVMKFKADEIEEFRIPMDNYYSFADVPVPGTRKSMNVVKIDDDLEANIDGLHMFIYGTDLYGTDFSDDEDDEDLSSTGNPNSTGNPGTTVKPSSTSSTSKKDYSSRRKTGSSSDSDSDYEASYNTSY